MPYPAPTMVTTAATSWTSSSPSSRWCPAPEQLMILEEMYRMGIHTPSASQIQQITAHLSSYGKIEGKNVFYWFQNHKARDRQRLRRKLGKQLQLSHQHHHNHQLCFQLPLNPQQQQQHPAHIFNHQQRNIDNCFVQYVNVQLPSHSPGSADSQHCPGFSPISSVQGGKIGSKRLMRETSPDHMVKANKAGVTRIHDLLDGMLTVNANRSCSQYLPQPLKTLDLFPTTATNLGEERSPQQNMQDHHF